MGKSEEAGDHPWEGSRCLSVQKNRSRRRGPTFVLCVSECALFEEEEKSVGRGKGSLEI